MKFGFFNDTKKEYVISTPRTPLPWINYLGCGDFFTLFSNTAGGYAFYKDAKLRRITRYRYNNCPLDSEGFHFYIKDGDCLWNPGWQPVKTELDSYSCRHGLGYSVITGEKNGIAAEQTVFVPVGKDCLLLQLELTNTGKEEKEFDTYFYLEFCLWDAQDDASNFQRNYSTGEVEVEGNAIYHKTEYRERRNHYSVLWSSEKWDGFDTKRDSFIGVYGSPAQPQAIADGGCKNSIAHGWQPCGAMQFKCRLAPGEKKKLIIGLGYLENPKDDKFVSPGVINKTGAISMMSECSTPEQFDREIDKLKKYWDGLLSTYSVNSPEEETDRMVNIWNQYQCMVTFNLSRSASYFESGLGRGMGFRDSCQDLLGFVHIIPERARERILDIAATQMNDGSAYHQYQPLTKKGNADIGSGFNDDPLWLVAAVYAYLSETGDYSILDEIVPFDNSESDKAALMEHLRRSCRFTVTHLGPHNLPLIGRADWNDCLNLNCFSETSGESFQITGPSEGPVAESIFIAGMFVLYGREYAEICRAQKLDAEADEMLKHVEAMKQAVLNKGWDGEWFLRAYDAFGQPVGSHSCDEGQIFIEPQGMCVMAGIGIETGQAQEALKSVADRLETKYGIVLHQPAYTRYRKELGEISSYPPGYKENAGIFCHNNPWIVCAETEIGHGDRAMELYKKTCPAYIEDISEIHRTEPYVYSQMVAGCDAPDFGEAKNSWLTGTSAWTFTAISRYILGMKPELSGLRIDPCIPKAWKQLKVRRVFRDCEYEIEIDNSAGVQKGVKKLIVNGKEYDGSHVLAEKGKAAVKVIMG